MRRLSCAVLLLSVVATGCSEQVGTGECGFSDELLPYTVGNSWTYRVTDVATAERKVKTQRLDRVETHAEYGEVIIQVTEKPKGDTESMMRRVGDQIRRYEQRDYDEMGVLERTTLYQPYRLRIDESMAMGEELSETYTKVLIKPGEPDVTSTITDVWQVVADDSSCSTALGSFTCIKYHRVRTEGGIAEKDFLFAEGIGKVIEDGTNQVEEIEGCGSAE